MASEDHMASRDLAQAGGVKPSREAEPSGAPDARVRAWETRRERHGKAGHGGYRTRRQSPLDSRALRLIVQLHVEDVLSEGQCCKALDLDRVAFRKLCDDFTRRGDSLGERILIARQKAELTQQQLSERVGVTRPQIANVEGGRSDVPLSRLYKIAEALGVSAKDLLPDAPLSTASPESGSTGVWRNQSPTPLSKTEVQS